MKILMVLNEWGIVKEIGILKERKNWRQKKREKKRKVRCSHEEEIEEDEEKEKKLKQKAKEIVSGGVGVKKMILSTFGGLICKFSDTFIYVCIVKSAGLRLTPNQPTFLLDDTHIQCTREQTYVCPPYTVL